MNQHEIAWLRKSIFVIVLILVVVSSVDSIRPVFAQTAPASFDVVDDYIRTSMKESRIPGAAQVYAPSWVHSSSSAVSGGAGPTGTAERSGS